MSERELILKIKTVADAAGFDKVKGHMSGLTDLSGKAGKAMGVGLLAGGVALAGFGAMAVSAAADVGESQSKVNAVFGESAGVINAFAADAATNLGTTQGAALAMTGEIGNLLTALGQAPEEAANMSTSVVQLATDLGSFNNLGTEEVLEKLRAGLTGEAEPLKSLGIAFGAADVEARALAMGLKSTKDELTEGDKIAARYALIMEQTKTAQGDFARTSDGLPNTLKMVKASISDVVAELGSALLPGVQNAATAFGDFLKGEQGQEFKDKLVDVFSSVGAALAGIDWNQVGETVSSVFDRIGSVVTFLSEHPGLVKIALFIGGLLVALAPIAAILGPIIGLFSALMPIISIVGTVLGALGPIVAALGAVLTFPLIAVIGLVIGAFLLWKAKGDEIKEALSAMVESIKAKWEEFKTKTAELSAELQAKWQEIKDKITMAVEAVLQMITAKWEQIKQTIQLKLHEISEELRLRWDAFLRLIQDKLESILGAITDKWAEVKHTISEALEAVRIVLEAAWNTIEAKIRQAFQVYHDIIFGAWDKIKGVVSDAIAAVRQVIDTGLELARQIIERQVAAFKRLFEFGADIAAKVRTAIESAIQAIRDKIEQFVTIGADVIEGFKRGFQRGWDTLKAFLESLFGDIIELAKKILHVGSPSRVFKWIGEMTGEGFLIGLSRTLTATAVGAIILAALAPIYRPPIMPPPGGVPGFGWQGPGGAGLPVQPRNNPGDNPAPSIGDAASGGFWMPSFRDVDRTVGRGMIGDMNRAGRGGNVAGSSANFWQTWMARNGGAVPDEAWARGLGFPIPPWLERLWTPEVSTEVVEGDLDTSGTRPPLGGNPVVGGSVTPGDPVGRGLRPRLGDVNIELAITLDGKEVSADVVKEIAGNAKLTDEMGEALDERAIRKTGRGTGGSV